MCLGLGETVHHVPGKPKFIFLLVKEAANKGFLARIGGDDVPSRTGEKLRHDQLVQRLVASQLLPKSEKVSFKPMSVMKESPTGLL